MEGYFFWYKNFEIQTKAGLCLSQDKLQLNGSWELDWHLCY